MVVSELVLTAHVLPPIKTSFRDLSLENPLPVRVSSVPEPTDPPGPDFGETEKSSGVWELLYWNEHVPLRQLPITLWTSTTTFEDLKRERVAINFRIEAISYLLSREYKCS